MRKWIMALCVLFAAATNSDLHADSKYQKHAAALRQAVWNWEISAFKNYTVPDQYRNESAVIIARHQQIEATGKSKFGLSTLFGGSMSRELYYMSVDRTMVRLNDQKALDEYAELTFREETKLLGFSRFNRIRTVVGARIIKPDGTIREIDVDRDAIVVPGEVSEDEGFKKLSIKGLSAGDILDYFRSEEMELETYNTQPQTFLLFSKHPILYYSVECVVGEKLTAEYRAINGAPDFERTTEGKNTLLRINRSDLKVIDNIDGTEWFSAYRSLPMIRLLLLNNSSKLIHKPASARKRGVHKDVGYERILQDKMGELAGWSNRLYGMERTHANVNKALANYIQKNPGATSGDIAAYLYDALRFYWPSDYFNHPASKFHIMLEMLLKEHGIAANICFVTSRYGARRKEVVSADDIHTFVSANNNRQLFFFPNGFRAAGEVPPIYEGEEMTSITVDAYIPRQADAIEGVTSIHRVPESTPEHNRQRTRCEVLFAEGDPGLLKIRRTTSLTGAMKESYLKLFALYEEWDKQMRKRLLLETDLWQELENARTDQMYIEQYRTYFEEKREEQKLIAEAEFMEYHLTDSGRLIDFTVKSIGATADAPAFEFETEYLLDGLVRKDGDDLILDAGKLIGGQWASTERERNRSFDAYIEAPVLVENKLSITIPPQYMVEGIGRLNMHIDNEFGRFVSSAIMVGNELRIITTMIYKTNLVPAKAWSVFMEVLDKADRFNAKSVVLKRRVAD